MSWNQAVSDALFPAESTSTQSGRALEPAGSAFVRRWLGVIVFIVSLFGAVSSDQKWRDACLLGTPALWNPQFSHALGLVEEAGRLKDEGLRLDRGREIGFCSRCSHGLGDVLLQGSHVHCSQLGSNHSGCEPDSPPQSDRSRFPPQADLRRPVLRTGPSDMSRRDGEPRDGSVGLNAPLLYSKGGFGILDPERCHEPADKAPARFPRRVSARGTEPVLSHVIEGDPANCNIAADGNRGECLPPLCPCVTPYRPELSGRVRPREAGEHEMYSARVPAGTASKEEGAT